MAQCFYNNERTCNENCPFYIADYKEQKRHRMMFCRRAYSEVIDDEPDDRKDQEIEELKNLVKELRKMQAEKAAKEEALAKEQEKLRKQNERDQLMAQIHEMIKKAKEESNE